MEVAAFHPSFQIYSSSDIVDDVARGFDIANLDSAVTGAIAVLDLQQRPQQMVATLFQPYTVDLPFSDIIRAAVHAML